MSPPHFPYLKKSKEDVCMGYDLGAGIWVPNHATRSTAMLDTSTSAINWGVVEELESDFHDGHGGTSSYIMYTYDGSLT